MLHLIPSHRKTLYFCPDGLKKGQVPISQGRRELVLRAPIARAMPGPHNMNLQLSLQKANFPYSWASLTLMLPHGSCSSVCSGLSADSGRDSASLQLS